MILGKMYAQNDILGVAMQASIVRNDVITNNIANSDVPGYKKKVVEFEDALSKALSSVDSDGNINLSSVTPKIMVIHEGMDYRLDGNNVDMESEMVDLYENSVRYDTMTSSIVSNSKRINLVLTGR